jgi:hypothetical protein
MRVALLATTLAMALTACGGDDAKEQARTHFGDYASAEVERSEAEGTLNRAFREISKAANERDRDAVVAAAKRGQTAATKIHGFLETELAAAAGLVGYGPASEDARTLERALRQSREGLRIIQEELEIATRDPLLDEPDNAREISRLARQSLRLSVPAAFGLRRATRAIALTLGVRPPFDTMFDAPSPSG